MDSASTSTAASPPKRRACVSCTAVKAKCSPHPTLGKVCERCNRLAKDCVFLNLPEKRRRLQSPRAVYSTATSPIPVNRVATLENKLEALAAEIAALKQQQQQRATPSVPTPTSDDDAQNAASTGAVFSTTESDADDTHHRQGRDIIDRGWITMDDAEQMVATFKQDFIPRFPFVALASSETAVQLRRRSPFLFLCIVAVPLYTNPALQQRLGTEIRRQLSLRLLFKAERSMDLLRGLLVHAAWYQYFACQGHGQLFMLSQLCVTVVHDLRLAEGGCSPGKGRGVSFSVDEDNGKRAVLGTFWLSVVVSRMLNRSAVVGLRHTKMLDDWSAGFAVGPEHVTDTAIQPMITLQAFASRLIEAFPRGPWNEDGEDGDSDQLNEQMPLHAATPSLLELESIKEKIMKDGFNPEIARYIELEVLHLEIWLSQVIANGGIPLNNEAQTFLWQNIGKHQQSLRNLLQMTPNEMYCMPLVHHLLLCASLTWLSRDMAQLLAAIMGRQDMSAASKMSEAQRAINEVGYLSSTEALSKKFEAAYAFADHPGRGQHEVDDGSELGRLLLHIRMLRRSYHWNVRRIVGAGDTTVGIVETNVIVSEGDVALSHHLVAGDGLDWGQGGDAELLLLPMDFETEGGAEDFDAGGTWSSINDFLFLDDGVGG
ncbi:hypothetical protein QBC34DRAFT_83340 [Podospora aff. communis PSN243]|uniref:Zn(2)-C6 fungal-type domain-containing protein n=1 Tax=Podospora aff. communis PSN243 TaxID=3040156 RepID=A0AAV9GQ26_9PEZI|nr:hypothetical protein QBC34DRAFT_83340 [Podospora aff. communis PSN243]